MWVAVRRARPDHPARQPPRSGRPAADDRHASSRRRVGANLWMAVLTAGAPGGAFEPGQVYEYELTAPWESTPSRRTDWAALSLAPATRPTFLAPPATAVELVVHHTSCRKPHGGGRDGLALALEDLATRFSGSPQPQPHLLVLSGDQIYADEVGHPLMPRVLRVAQDLIGIDETDVFGSPPPIGGRGPGTTALGYTGRDRQPPVELRRVPGHVPAGVVARALAGHAPAVPDDPGPRPSRRRPGRHRGVLGRGADQRRAVPHRAPGGPARARQRPVADDLRRPRDHRRLEHRPRLGQQRLRQAGGRRAVTNGLLAYALCQHWGNKPAAFATPGTPERRRARRRGDGRVRRHPGQPGHGLRTAAGGPGRSPAGGTAQPGAA